MGAGAGPRIGAAVLAEAQPEAGQDRTVALSFSSEAPVLRDYHFGAGWEVLGHRPGEVDLARIAAGAVPLLKDHHRDLDSKVGTVARAWIEGGRGKALVTFAATPKAMPCWRASARPRCKACLSDTPPKPSRWWVIWKASRLSA